VVVKIKKLKIIKAECSFFLEEKKLSHIDAAVFYFLPAVFYFLPAEGVMILKSPIHFNPERVSNSQHSNTFLV
jgi:hypothetical protein